MTVPFGVQVLRPRVVWKYELELAGNEFFIPASRSFLTVGVQENRIVLWVAVDPDTPDSRVRFWVTGTGSAIPDWAYHYVGTVQVEGWVWHTFADTGL